MEGREVRKRRGREGGREGGRTWWKGPQDVVDGSQCLGEEGVVFFFLLGGREGGREGALENGGREGGRESIWLAVFGRGGGRLLLPLSRKGRKEGGREGGRVRKWMDGGREGGRAYL